MRTPSPQDATGEIEIEATELLVLNDTRLRRFRLGEAIQNEEVRLKYRYGTCGGRRCSATSASPRCYAGHPRQPQPAGFLEIETPILTRARRRARAIFWCQRLHPGGLRRCRSRRAFKQYL